MELDRRKMKILSAIVSEYIRTGEPVGLQTGGPAFGYAGLPGYLPARNVPVV